MKGKAMDNTTDSRSCGASRPSAKWTSVQVPVVSSSNNWTETTRTCFQRATRTISNIMENIEAQIKGIKVSVSVSWLSEPRCLVRRCLSSETSPDGHWSTAAARRSSLRRTLREDLLEQKTISKRPTLSHQLKMTRCRTTDTRLSEGIEMCLVSNVSRDGALDRQK